MKGGKREDNFYYWTHDDGTRYLIVDGIVKITLRKAKRAPFSVRPIKLGEWKKREITYRFVVVSKTRTHGLKEPCEIDCIEAYCSSEACAKGLVEKWNDEAALLIMTEGTAAFKLVGN